MVGSNLELCLVEQGSDNGDDDDDVSLLGGFDTYGSISLQSPADTRHPSMTSIGGNLPQFLVADCSRDDEFLGIRLAKDVLEIGFRESPIGAATDDPVKFFLVVVGWLGDWWLRKLYATTLCL